MTVIALLQTKSDWESICGINEETAILVNLRNKIQALVVTLYWTKAHVRTNGNEKADEYGKIR